MSDFDFIRRKIADKREEVHKLDRERDRLLAQIAAYEELLPAEPKPANGDGDGASQQRGLSPQSREFMALLKNKDRFGFDEAVQMANQVGINIEKKGMRTRLHNYVQSGYVARISDGVFQLTKKGIESAA